MTNIRSTRLVSIPERQWIAVLFYYLLVGGVGTFQAVFIFIHWETLDVSTSGRAGLVVYLGVYFSVLMPLPIFLRKYIHVYTDRVVINRRTFALEDLVSVGVFKRERSYIPGGVHGDVSDTIFVDDHVFLFIVRAGEEELEFEVTVPGLGDGEASEMLQLLQSLLPDAEIFETGYHEPAVEKVMAAKLLAPFRNLFP